MHIKGDVMTPTYYKISDRLSGKLSEKYYKILTRSWTSLGITMILGVYFLYRYFKSPTMSVINISLFVVLIICIFITILLNDRQKNAISKIVQPVNVSDLIRIEPIPEMIKEIENSTRWLLTIFQVFTVFVTTLFFMLQSYLSYTSINLVLKSYEFRGQSLIKSAKRMDNMLKGDMNIISAIIAFIVAMLIVVLSITMYNSFISKKELIKQCLRVQYYKPK